MEDFMNDKDIKQLRKLDDLARRFIIDHEPRTDEQLKIIVKIKGLEKEIANVIWCSQQKVKRLRTIWEKESLEFLELKNKQDKTEERLSHLEHSDDGDKK